MLFRFSVSHSLDGSYVYDLQCPDETSALRYVKFLLRGQRLINSITVHRYLSNDSCGRIEFIGTFIEKDGLVYNRETKQAL